MTEYQPSENYSKDMAQESKHWGQLLTKNGNYFSWLHSPLILRVINRRVTGDPSVDWFSWIRNNYLADIKVEKALVLGCGFSNWESKLIEENICSSVDAIDISEECIMKARERAENGNIAGLNYLVADVNNLVLPENTYGLILCVMSLHHFTMLESLFFQINRALKQDGYFAANEFVGPTYFQWTDEQLRLINNILDIMPERYKIRTNDGIVQNRIDKPSLTEFINNSPFEAIRSSEIITNICTFLDVVEIKPYGGTLLHMLLNFLIANFDESKPEDRFALELMTMFEDREIEQKNIESDFVVILCRKKQEGMIPYVYEDLQKLRLENHALKIKLEKENNALEMINNMHRFISELKKIVKSLPLMKYFHRQLKSRK